MPRLKQMFGPGDPRCDPWIEEAPQVARRRRFTDRTVQHPAGAGDRQSDQSGHQADRDHLVDLRAPQDRRRSHVDDEIPRDRHAVLSGKSGVEDQRQPARSRRGAGDHDIDRLHPQRTQRDEDEDVEKGWRLEIEGGRLAVLDMEAPDQAQQQGHVGQDRCDLDRCRDRSTPGEAELRHRKSGIGRQRPRDRHERRVCGRRASGQCVEGDEDRAQHELDDAHQDVAAMLLGAKFLPDALRDFLLCGAPLEEIGDQGAQRGACSRTRRAAGLSVAPSGRTRVNRHLTGALSIATGLRRRETGQQESGRQETGKQRARRTWHSCQCKPLWATDIGEYFPVRCAQVTRTRRKSAFLSNTHLICARGPPAPCASRPTRSRPCCATKRT